MSVLAIVQPLPIAAISGTLAGTERLLSPFPREAAISTGGDGTIEIDLGAPVPFDTVLLGYSNAGSGAWHASCGVADYASTALPDIPLASTRLSRPRHYFTIFPSPVTARFLRLAAPGLTAGYAVGVLAVGLALRPSFGQEWGAGRTVTDTGSATRLLSGGFGLSPGARAGGWQWTLGDLSEAEADALYGLQLGAGMSQPILVVEDPDPTMGLNERIHWCQLLKLAPSERRNRKQIRWDMAVGDWA